MSRTIAEIYNDLNAIKSSFTELNDYIVHSNIPGSTSDTGLNLAIDVTSGSKVAIWRLWLWIMAVGSWTVEVLFDRLTSDVEEKLSMKNPHTLRWYSEESKKWQYGHSISWVDNKYIYEVDDPEARIVSYAAASERNGRIKLKVAKDSGGTKAPLTTQEIDAFADYWSKWKDAGVNMDIISQPPDQLKANMTIIRDRMVLDSQNNLLRNNSVNPISDAIASFENGLEFDGILRLSRLVDAIQAAEGVVDVKLKEAWHKPADGTYKPVEMFVESVAGYFKLMIEDSQIEYHDNVEATIFD